MLFILFYIELLSEFKERFVFLDPIFDIISIVDPREWRNSNIISFLPVVRRFSILKELIDMQKLDNEWRECYLLNPEDLGLSSGFIVEEYWSKIFEMIC